MGAVRVIAGSTPGTITGGASAVGTASRAVRRGSSIGTPSSGGGLGGLGGATLVVAPGGAGVLDGSGLGGLLSCATAVVVASIATRRPAANPRHSRDATSTSGHEDGVAR